MEKDFVPHEVVWTHENVSRIWDFFVQSKLYEGQYFCDMVGDSIIRTTLRYHNLKGNILDFGCGRGHLLSKLIKREVYSEGVDFSSDSVNLVENQLHNEKYFKGVTLAKGLPTPLANNQFDVVFFITAIEHILKQDMTQTLQELNRLTKKDGYIVIVTNNEEDLEKSKILCPECGCIFHKVQHVSTWTKTSLSSIMKDNGFKEIVCRAMRLRGNGITGFVRHLLIKIQLHMFRKKQPHLLYIGKKL